MLVIILSVLAVFIATLAVFPFQTTQNSIADIIFLVVSAFSTCGINTGFVSPDMPIVAKWIFIGVLWVGRLEVIQVVMLVFALFRLPE